MPGPHHVEGTLTADVAALGALETLWTRDRLRTDARRAQQDGDTNAAGQVH